VGDSPEQDQIYRLTYDGQVADEHGYAVMGGSAEAVAAHMREHYREGASLEDAVRLAVEALGKSEGEGRTIAAHDLEVAVLDRSRSQQRKFKRLPAGQLATIIGRESGTPHLAGESTSPSAGASDEAGHRAGEPPVAPPRDG
jgi:proteasome alpha subunit